MANYPGSPSELKESFRRLTTKIQMAIKLKLGDKVRSLGGVEGEIVRLNEDRRSVTVQVPGEWPGTGIVSIPVGRLRPIANYSSERKRLHHADHFPRLLA